MCVMSAQRHLQPDLVDDVGDLPLQQHELEVVADASRVQLLAQADGAERVDAGTDGWPRRSSVRLVLPPPTSASSVHAPSNADAVRAPCRTARNDQAALFGLVDDLEGDAGAPANAIEKGVAVAGLAHGAGRDGAHLLHAVAVDDLAEPFERRERGIDGLRSG